MLRVTWEWIGIDAAAFDVANTVAISGGVAHDLLEPEGEYERWADAAAASPALDRAEAAALEEGRSRVLELREQIRAVLCATAAGEPSPEAAVAALNAASRSSPQWPELSVDGEVRARSDASPLDRLLATYARSAIEIAADGRAQLRICGAPSCGMFYRPRRRQQRWCSEPCGTRARFARHYRAHRSR